MSISIKVTDVDGNEASRTVDDNTTLGDLLDSGAQTGLIEGAPMDNSTTLRNGDHIEILRNSGKAGVN